MIHQKQIDEARAELVTLRQELRTLEITLQQQAEELISLHRAVHSLIEPLPGGERRVVQLPVTPAQRRRITDLTDLAGPSNHFPVPA